MPDDRSRRIAENESRFRDINERLERDLRALPQTGTPVPFVCECGRLDCSLPVQLTLEDYERVRADPHTFAVVPGHEIGAVEDVVVRTAHFNVVRKLPETHGLVERTDPRSGGA